MSQNAPILIDVMSTLVFDPFYDLMPAFFGMTLEELIAEKHPEAWLRFEQGACDEEWFLDHFFADGRDYDREGMKRATFNAYAWLEGMEALCEALHEQGVVLHLFSNYSDWYRQIEDRLKLSRFCRWTFVSCHEGLRKPDPDSYRRAAELAGVPLEGTIFIDDNQRNIGPAADLGLDAIRFEDAAQLHDELCQRGYFSA